MRQFIKGNRSHYFPNTGDLIVEVPCSENLLSKVFEKAKAEYEVVGLWKTVGRGELISLTEENAVKFIDFAKKNTDLDVFGYNLSERELKMISGAAWEIYQMLKDRAIYV